MIDISQWRTSIGLWYHSTQRTNTDGGLLLLGRSGDVDDGYLATLSLILFISLLLILAGDIELNPGPTELTPTNAVQFLVDNGFNIKDKWIELITLLRVSLEERERLETMASRDQDFHEVLKEGLQWWITNSADPSWKELISAVENCGDKDVATNMRKQIEIKEEALLPEDILKEIQGIITWPQLGLVLNIEKEVIERTAQLFGGDEERALQHVVTNWLDNDPDASWEKLAKAVMRIPMLRQKGAQLYSKYVSKDLTADAVCKELEDLVQDWFQLGYTFLCNSQRVREAGRGDSNEEKRKDVIGYWLKSDPIASWELVARRIEDCFPQHEALAEEIRQKHLPKVDTTPLIRPPTPEPETELSIKTAFKATQGVDDWYALGWFLKLKQEELIDIEEEHTRPDQCRNAVLKLWLEKHPISAEWVDLANALRCMPQHVGKSETIQTKYCEAVLEKPDLTGPKSEEKEQEIKSLNEKINSLTQTYETKISELKESTSDLEGKFEEKEQEIKSLNEKINSLTQTYETKISELKESTSELEGKFEEKEQEIKSLNEKINSLTQTYETKISELKESTSELEGNLREATEKADMQLKMSSVKTAEIENLQKELLNCKEELQRSTMTRHSPSRTETSPVQLDSFSNLELPLLEELIKNDVSVQFDYLIPVNDTLHGVQVGGKKLFLIQGDSPQYFNWDGYGLRINVPEGTVSSTETCEIVVTALIGGQFTFPKGSELVSAVYGVSIASEIQQPLTLEIQHCVSLKTSEQSSYMRFAKASSKQLPLPYQFHLLEGGVFSLDTRYGAISLTKFCFVCVLLVYPTDWININSPTSSTTSESDSIEMSSSPIDDQNSTELPKIDTETELESIQPAVLPNEDSSITYMDNAETDQHYFAKVFYKDQVGNNYEMELIVVRDLDFLKQCIETQQDLRQAESGQQIRFRFKKDIKSGGFIELVFKETTIKGWHILPQLLPCQILKKDVDDFGNKENIKPPSCIVLIHASENSTDLDVLYYPVQLIGIEPSNRTIFITRYAKKIEGQFARKRPSQSLEEISVPTKRQHLLSSSSEILSPISEDSPGGSGIVSSNNAEVLRKRSSTSSLGSSSQDNVNISKLRQAIHKVLTSNYSSLRDISRNCLEALASEMYTAGLINIEVQRSPSFDGIINEFKSGMGFFRRPSELENHCIKFLTVFAKLGGSFTIAGNAIKEDWIEVGKTECGLELRLIID